jgi:hypothetical protein
MSIADFQRALCDMTLRPVLAASVLRSGASSLSDYQLSAMEQDRLIAVVRQPGMSVNCTLARANRFAPIADAFPLTCSLLKPLLRSLLDELWSLHRPDSYQLGGEAEAFAAFMQMKLSHGALDHPYADEVFSYERAAWELIQTFQGSMFGPKQDVEAERSASVHFQHDPHILVPCLERDDPPPTDLPAGDYLVRLTLRGETLQVQTEQRGPSVSVRD